jgi:hypothetical protein
LDDLGTWNIHIDEITSKAFKRIGTLRNLKFTIQRVKLEIPYNSHIRPILEYGEVIWDGIPEQYLVHKVEKVQIEALRIGPNRSFENYNWVDSEVF